MKWLDIPTRRGRVDTDLQSGARHHPSDISLGYRWLVYVSGRLMAGSTQLSCIYSYVSHINAYIGHLYVSG